MRKKKPTYKTEHSVFFKAVTTAVLTTMGAGFIGAVGTMFMDIQNLKAGERHVADTVKEMAQDIKDIKWFLIKENGGKIIKQRGE